MKNLKTASLYDVSNAGFIEGLYEQFLEEPSSIPETWQDYFEGLKNGSEPATTYISHRAVQEQLVQRSKSRRERSSSRPGVERNDDASVSRTKHAAVQRLINSYRLLGHMRADTDPLKLRARPSVPDLDYHFHGLEEADLTESFFIPSADGSQEKIVLHELIDRLNKTYAGTLSAEFMHIIDSEQKTWLKSELEHCRGEYHFSDEKKNHILETMVGAEGMERYLHTRFSGQKRFSLEGGESLIPLLDEVIQEGGSLGLKEVVIGMAHRGRLSVLVNVMGKQPSDVMSEFEGRYETAHDKMTGDVKYHKGYSSDVRTPGGPVHLALAFNPSHLEIISPVVHGSSRARQDRRGNIDHTMVLPLIIHGDAAIAGQGVVYEVAQLSNTRGFSTGGSIHVVVNNQVGFTTSHPLDARSSQYCTDIGKVTQSPIFHVNGDDPEAVVFAAKMAIRFRQKFHKDVYINMICYRRHGHNEGDEPAASQPMMYNVIRAKKTSLGLYADRLIDEGVISESDPRGLTEAYRGLLEKGQPVSHNFLPHGNYSYMASWVPFLDGHWTDAAFTGLPSEKLTELGLQATKLPEGFSLHRSVAKIMEDRAQMVQGEIPIDWGCAETLAYASLLNDGYAVRIVGQDSNRGTFFHRHAAVHDSKTGETYKPLAALFPRQPEFTVIDSVLSEEAVLGFEYGYSTTDPNSLVLWEAQYGDFVNGAQVVIDQFISSSEQKWHLFSGLVMMLPHGWEGQGPEHSSARLERFLQLCAQENMQVCVPSTAAQMFHMLRRQMIRKLRIPLIIMSPKSMLRKKESFSSIQDLAEGEFQPVIGEVEALDPEEVDRVVLCSGKVYFTLAQRRLELGLKNVAIVRIEQLYPWPYQEFQDEFEKWHKASTFVWTQEEPRNQGAWYQIQHRIRRCIRKRQTLTFAGRIPCSAPAGGIMSRHMERERRLIDEALGLIEATPAPHSMPKQKLAVPKKSIPQSKPAPKNAKSKK